MSLCPDAGVYGRATLCVSWISALQGGIHEGSGKIPVYVLDHNGCAHHSFLHSPHHSSILQLWGVLSTSMPPYALESRASSLYGLATGQFSPSNVSPRDQSQVIELGSSQISIHQVIPWAPLICFITAPVLYCLDAPDWLALTSHPFVPWRWDLFFCFVVGSASFSDP